MTAKNPYNSSRPGQQFVGYERTRRQIVEGFRNGNSFAILGGAPMRENLPVASNSEGSQ